MITKTCVTCGKEYPSDNKNSKCCSTSCSAALFWKEVREGKRPPRKKRTDDNHGPGKGWFNKLDPARQEEISKKISESRRGVSPSNKGVPHSEEAKQKMRDAKIPIHEAAMARKETKNCKFCNKLLELNQQQFCSRSCTISHSIATGKIVCQLTPQNIIARDAALVQFRKDNPDHFYKMGQVRNDAVSYEDKVRIASVAGSAASFTYNLPPKPGHASYNYKGVDFRSRPEIALAKLLDKVEINWEYEVVQQEYTSNNGNQTCWYPDFLLPELKLLLECKGVWRWIGNKDQTMKEFNKIIPLVEQGLLYMVMEDQLLASLSVIKTQKEFFVMLQESTKHALTILDQAHRYYTNHDEPIIDELDLFNKMNELDVEKKVNNCNTVLS